MILGKYRHYYVNSSYLQKLGLVLILQVQVYLLI